MRCFPLDALLLKKLAVTFPEGVRTPGVVFTAVERKREAADLEASLDRLGGDGCPRLFAPRGHDPTPRGLQLARLEVCYRRRGVGGVLAPHRPLHLLVEHETQRLEERSQPTWDEDDDGISPPLEVGNEIFVSVALEVVQYEDALALLDYASVVRTELPALRDPKRALPCVTPVYLLHAERHASRGVPGVGAVYRKDLCRDGSLLRLSLPALPRHGWRDERRPLEDHAQRNLLAVRHGSKT